MIDLSRHAPGLVLPAATAMRRYTSVEAWRAGRQAGIGASDVPRVLGLSPHGGPWSVFADRVGLARPDAESDVQRRGLRWERRILEDFHDETGVTVIGPLGPVAVLGPEPWLGVTPDSFLCDHGGPWETGEVKTDTSEVGRWAWGDGGQTFETWGEARGQVREDYAAQLYTQLWATGLEWGRLIVRRSLDDQRWYRLRRDDAVIDWMRPLLAAFWQLVLDYRAGDRDAHPDPDDSAVCMAAIARMTPLGRDLVPATVDDQVLARSALDHAATAAQHEAAARLARATLALHISKSGAYGIDLGDGDKVLFQRGAGDTRHIRIYARGSHARPPD